MAFNLKLQCRSIPPGPAGNSNCRIIFSGDLWDEWDLTFCVHGEKLRWGCDACDAHFDARPRTKEAVLARQQPPA